MSTRENLTLDKSKAFALRIVRLYKFLSEDRKEYVLSKQLLRSGTSIGANLAEAQYGISDKDFLAKAYIALKECAETNYWLNLLFQAEYLRESEFTSINADCVELLKLLTSVTKTLKGKIQSKASSSSATH